MHFWARSSAAVTGGQPSRKSCGCRRQAPTLQTASSAPYPARQAPDAGFDPGETHTRSPADVAGRVAMCRVGQMRIAYILFRGRGEINVRTESIVDRADIGA